MDALRHWTRQHLEGDAADDEREARDRREREAARHRLDSLKAQVRAATGDYTWEPRSARHTGAEGDDAGHA